MITATLVGDRELIARLDSLPQKLQAALLKKVAALAINLREKIQREHLSGPTGAHSLSVRTGALRRSATAAWKADGNTGVTGRVFYTADVPYAAIHEFGGTIHIPEIVPKNAKALHFFWARVGGWVFFTKVRAHDVVMPERAPMRTAFHGYVPTIKAELELTVRTTIADAVQKP